MPSPRPLRIALFTGNYVHIEDGVSRTLGRLVGYLVAQGHDVLVFGPTTDRPVIEQPGMFFPTPSVPIPSRPEYRFTTGFPYDVRERIEAFSPDIVHLATPDILGHRALKWATRRRLPVVATYHTHFVSYLDYYKAGFLRPVLHRIARSFYGRCDEVYVPTATMEADLRRQGVTSTIRLWPRGIELDLFSPDCRSEAWRLSHGIETEDVVVSLVSRLVKEKGLDVYSSVVNRLLGIGLPIRALVVGDGPEREAIKTVIPSAILTGHLSGEALATAYASSDVFLFPSETETFGNVTLEAMASGLPVVCADAAGSRSLVRPGETGFLCRPRDVDSFAEATERLVRDKDLRKRLGAGGRTAARHYNWPSVLSLMVSYYEGVLARHISAPPQV